MSSTLNTIKVRLIAKEQGAGVGGGKMITR
jgi:hypothetical protein